MTASEVPAGVGEAGEEAGEEEAVVAGATAISFVLSFLFRSSISLSIVPVFVFEPVSVTTLLYIQSYLCFVLVSLPLLSCHCKNM
jgi:hypothetical protein